MTDPIIVIIVYWQNDCLDLANALPNAEVESARQGCETEVSRGDGGVRITTDLWTWSTGPCLLFEHPELDEEAQEECEESHLDSRSWSRSTSVVETPNGQQTGPDRVIWRYRSVPVYNLSALRRLFILGWCNIMFDTSLTVQVYPICSDLSNDRRDMLRDSVSNCP